MSLVKTVATAIGAAALMATAATSATTNLRIQTHYAPETVSGKLAAQYVADIESMSKNEKVLAEIQAHVDKSNSKVANVQQIKKFTLLSNEWTDSSGELTPSLKLKRHVVTERYKDEIESMYEEA